MTDRAWERSKLKEDAILWAVLGFLNLAAGAVVLYVAWSKPGWPWWVLTGYTVGGGGLAALGLLLLAGAATNIRDIRRLDGQARHDPTLG